MTDPGTPGDTSRRAFLRTSAGGVGSGWILLNLPILSALAGCARDAAGRGDPLQGLSAEEGRTLDAVVARIIPSDDGTPGATEAGATHFVDAALVGPFAALAEPLRAGLADLDGRARDEHDRLFSELPTAVQDRLLADLEEAEPNLFFPLRFLTIIGVMADPSHGGNRDHAGWAILGRDHAGAYRPPFGHYDAEVMEPAPTGEGA